MAKGRTNWVDVDLDGLRKLLERRGKEFAIFELVQNAWDENITQVEITLTRPEHGRSLLTVVDDSPDGFRDLTQSFTMFAESYKKGDPRKRGAFNLGEKFVLALCDEVSIASTTGTVHFTKNNRVTSRVSRKQGTKFEGSLRLTHAEWEAIGKEVHRLLPEVQTIYNGETLITRGAVNTFEAKLPTVFADEHGQLRRRERLTTVRLYEPLEGETATLYEMGIPVVETGDRWHVCVEQKVPLNMERDNVTPAFLAAVRVAVVNHTSGLLDSEIASEPWVRAAAADSRINSNAFQNIITTRFGDNAVSFDPSDQGSNREAASKEYTVVSGGSLSKGEWDNVRRTQALKPAGQLFPTNHKGKVADKVYDRREWTPSMIAYADFVAVVSPALVDAPVGVRYIEDAKITCQGSFGNFTMTVNLAHHDVKDWHSNLELMLHELAHTVVQSNDHLNHKFYDTVGKLGAKLALLTAQNVQVASFLGRSS